MRHALFLPIFDALSDPLVVARLAAEAEAEGWDGVFVWDHVVYKSPVEAVADPWITLAAIASSTEELRLGPMVTPLSRRRPAMVARETASLDRLSRGRFVLGVGLGHDDYRELSGTGEETDAKLRAARLDESLEILRAAWTGEPVHHHGEHYTIDGLTFRPTPWQDPDIPVWVAVRHGNTRPLRRAARHDGVFPIGIEHPDQLRETLVTIDSLRDANGDGEPRHPFDVALDAAPGADPRPYEEAGATWWLTTFDWSRTSVSEVESVVRGGPPR